MDNTLIHLFNYNLWANLRLVNACAGLSPEHLDATPDGGTFGTIRDTLLHLLAAEERYVTLLTGEPAPEPPLRESEPFPGFDRLRERAQRNGDALVALATADPYERVLSGTRGGETYTMPAFIPMVQAIHHANEHRSQVTGLLGRLQLEPPDISGWAYGEFARS